MYKSRKRELMQMKMFITLFVAIMMVIAVAASAQEISSWPSSDVTLLGCLEGTRGETWSRSMRILTDPEGIDVWFTAENNPSTRKLRLGITRPSGNIWIGGYIDWTLNDGSLAAVVRASTDRTPSSDDRYLELESVIPLSRGNVALIGTRGHYLIPTAKGSPLSVGPIAYGQWVEGAGVDYNAGLGARVQVGNGAILAGGYFTSSTEMFIEGMVSL